VWVTAAGAFVTWEPVDLGLRHAEVVQAERAVAAARADATLTRLQVAQTVAVAYLVAVAADQVVTAAQADVDRRGVLATVVHTLVANELRPGADGSRADAERAAAQVRLLRAQQARDLARLDLGRALGLSSPPVLLASTTVLQVPPAAAMPALDPETHPRTRVQAAALDASRADEDTLARTDRPRLYLQSSVFGRGSGIEASGAVSGGWRGLGFDRANWAAGFQVVLPNPFDLPAKHARQAAAAATSREAAARLDEVRLAVATDQQAALIRVQTAQAVAASTPTELASARLGEQQARARYDAGLATLVEVADAQNLLAQADVQDQLARLDVWRALVEAAVARGDLSSLTALVRQP
jgi:outer membrane protein TolC